MKRASPIATAGAALLALAGCDPTTTVTADDVIVSLSASPDMLVANGAATTVIEIQSVPDHVKDGLSVKLTAINATWTGVIGASQELPLGPDGVTTARLTASRLPGDATVIAEIAGYQHALPVPLVAAMVPTVTHVLSGRLTAGMASTVQVTVTPQVAGGGLPSAGTKVEFGVAATPGGSAYVTTPTVVMDAAATSAATTVMASATTAHVEVTVSVTPPGATAPTATETIPLDP